MFVYVNFTVGDLLRCTVHMHASTVLTYAFNLFSLFFAGSRLVYYVLVGALVVLVIVVSLIVILVVYLVKRYRKKKDHKVEMTESARQPLLPPRSATRRSFYDSIQSWPLPSSIVRAAQRLTSSVSIRAFGHKEGA